MRFGIGVWSTNRDNLSVIYIEGKHVTISSDLQSVIIDDQTVLTARKDQEIAFIKKPPYLENEDYFYQSEMFSW